ncbi:hypothetical protein BT69DRAFT_1197600, partial [Atractiella rhizophila]
NANRPDTCNPDALPLRTNESYFEYLEQIENAPNQTRREKLRTEFGIVKCVIWSRLATFFPTFFFPPDLAHLLYENVTPHLWDLWSGKVEPVEGDRHLLSTDQKILVGELMDNAVIDLPARFSNRIRNLDKFRNTRYSIYEWLGWVHWHSIPILLEVGFHIELIQHWTNFVSAVKIITNIHAASLSQLQSAGSFMSGFCTGFEELYVRNIPALVRRVPMSLHQLLHIVPLSKILGSLMNFTQLPLERNLGTEKDKLGSRRLPYAELANNLIRREQLNILKLYIPRIDTSPKPTK